MDKMLENFQVGSHGDYDIFWHKLTKEYGWSLDYSKNAFYEYKRFIHLAKVYGCRVTPSIVVDKVWHMHMTFTKSYWNELCQDVLQMELHHAPSSLGKKAEREDNECYEKTKELYLAEFGEVPPSKFWPQLGKNRNNKKLFGLFTVFCATLLTACSTTEFKDVGYILKWVIGIYVVFKVFKWLSSGSGKGGGGKGGCSSGCGSSCGGGD